LLWHTNHNFPELRCLYADLREQPVSITYEQYGGKILSGNHNRGKITYLWGVSGTTNMQALPTTNTEQESHSCSCPNKHICVNLILSLLLSTFAGTQRMLNIGQLRWYHACWTSTQQQKDNVVCARFASPKARSSSDKKMFRNTPVETVYGTFYSPV